MGFICMRRNMSQCHCRWRSPSQSRLLQAVLAGASKRTPHSTTVVLLCSVRRMEMLCQMAFKTSLWYATEAFKLSTCTRPLVIDGSRRGDASSHAAFPSHRGVPLSLPLPSAAHVLRQTFLGYKTSRAPQACECVRGVAPGNSCK